jgi:D-alanyl-D-alanine carboxypeptidase (penicillin-binding protein 5/6)
VALGVASDLFVTIPRGRYDDLEAKLLLQQELMAPLSAGQELGQVRVTLDGDVIAERGLLALTEVPAAGFIGRTLDGLSLWAGGLFGGDEDE